MQGVRTDRVIGCLLGLAAGDALGAGYEFRGPVAEKPRMRGGGLGGWAQGEWTDDTQMATCIAQVTATGVVNVGRIGERFLAWLADGPADVGVQTQAVLAGASGPDDLAAAAHKYYREHPHSSAGNGSLMRTAPVALACLGDDVHIAAAAREVSALTHGDPLAGDACVLWCIAIDRAVRFGRLDGARDGLALLPADARTQWAGWLDEAEQSPPARFRPNGFVVTALQAAYAAIRHTPMPDPDPCGHLQDALAAAVRIGDDTDTVAAVAGSLLGARWGASAIPFAWRRLLHGWPGLDANDLARLAALTARGGKPDAAGWPGTASLVDHYGHQPLAAALNEDPGVVVGNLAGLPRAAVDAVVSLCRVGTEDVLADVEHHQVLLVDQADANPNLAFCVRDAADAVTTLRAEDKRVFLHCAGGHSRTPTVAAFYLADRLGISGQDALTRVAAVLPGAYPNPSFRRLLQTLSPDESA